MENEEWRKTAREEKEEQKQHDQPKISKNYVLKEIADELEIGYEEQRLFTEFLDENSKLNNDEFYKKFEASFSWVEYLFKCQNLIRQRKIESHLKFFKVLTIISMIIVFLYIVVVPWFKQL
jgi:hypothetical protein